MVPFDAVVLAGGQARRLGGADKPGLELGGRSLLQRVLDACRDAGRVVVVGPPRDLPGGVVQVREHPPGGGPVPAVRAGLPHVTAPCVAVLAADLPFLDARTLAQLREQAQGHDGALLLDDEGREQWLCGVWSTPALRAALDELQSPRLREALSRLDAVRLPEPATAAAWFDCDTDDDVRRAQARIGGGPS